MDAVLFQTADADRYFPMLAVTLPANRAFCLRHGIRLEAFVGIRRGRHPWHATYNRLGFLRDRLAEGFRGWAIYLDADAFVADQRFPIAGFCADNAGVAMIHPNGSGQFDWDVNAGVFLWNFAQDTTREVATRWIAAFDAIADADLDAAENWDDVPNDQVLLHGVLRDNPGLAAGLRIDDGALLGYQQSRFIKQFVRNELHSGEQRVARIAREVALAMQASGIRQPVDGPTVVQAWQLLRGRPPEHLDAALEALAAPSLAEMRRRILDRPR